MNMRHYFLFLLCLPLCFLTGCGSSPEARQADGSPSPEAEAAVSAAPESAAAQEASGPEILVFAAASMQETLDEIQTMYADVDPEATLVYNFDSSGTLKTQIEEGAPCDVFISAAQKQMNQLENGEDGEEGLHLIDPESRINLLENKVTLVVPEGNPAGITGFADLAARLREGGVLLAIGNSDVPVGQYTQRIFTYFDLNEEELAAAGELTYGTNVKEVTTQILEGSVDCGIIYATDAFSAGLEVVDEATAAMCGQVIYPAAVLCASQDKAAAQAFLDYLQTPEAMAVFESVGFSPAPAD